MANGKKIPVATTAIARELAAFLWAIGQQVCAPEAGHLRDPSNRSLGARFRRQSLAPGGATSGGGWGLAAQRGQAEACCHVMNTDVWPHLRRHPAKRTSVDTERKKESNSPTNLVHSAGGKATVGNPQP
jgi:hypothetical protein